jgi:hypothetical protein
VPVHRKRPARRARCLTACYTDGKKENMNSLIVKSSLIIYVLLAGISIFIMWKNSEAPDALKNVGAVVASLLPILIFGFSNLTPEKTEKTLHFMLLFDTESKQLVFGNIPSTYSTRFAFTEGDLTPAGLKKIQSQYDLIDKAGLDVIERILVSRLSLRFQHNWDYVFDKMKGPGFNQIVFTPGKMKEKTILKNEEIRALFKGNTVYDDDSIPVSWQFCLPPNGRLERSVSDHTRTITLKSKLYSIEFRVTGQAMMVMQQGIPNILARNPQNENQYYASFYTINATGTSSLLSKYSEESKYYKRWFENVIDVASELDWEKISGT